MIAYTVSVDGRVVYVGISKDSTPGRRWKDHVRDSRRKKPPHRLQQEIKRLGIEAFTVEPVASSASWDDLCEVERILIMQHGTYFWLGNGYNMTLGGEGSFGMKQPASARKRISVSRAGFSFTEEVLAKLREDRQSPEWREKMTAAKDGWELPLGHPFLGCWMGRTHTDKTRVVMSTKATAIAATPEFLERMARHHKGKKRSGQALQNIRDGIVRRTERLRRAAVDAREVLL
jgi:hypothetical protein